MGLICPAVKEERTSSMVIEFKGVKVCCVIACSQKLWKKRSNGLQLGDGHEEDTDGKEKHWNSGMKLWDL